MPPVVPSQVFAPVHEVDMPQPSAQHRDRGLRRVSRATRWVTSAAAAAIVAFALYFGTARPGTSATPRSAVATTTPAAAPASAGTSSEGTAVPPTTTTSPRVVTPVPHARTRGS
jgi:hypothetical protein